VLTLGFDESLGLLASIERTIHQQGKNNRGNHGIEAIPLAAEGVNQECDTCNRRRDEKYQSQLNHAAPAESKSIPDNSRESTQVRRFAAKNMVIRGLCSVADKINDSSDENHRSRKCHAGTEKVTYDDVHLLCGDGIRIRGHVIVFQ
jgi:hypothetical protein